MAPGPIVSGSVIMPDSERLTRSTWWAWSAIERLRCRIPTPPWRARAIAIRDSVTVSIAAETSGMRIESSRVSREVVSTSLGMTSVSPGRSRTSSYVRPTIPKGSAGGAAGPVAFWLTRR